MKLSSVNFDQLIDYFIESVDLVNTRILRAQEIVFFCGGKIDNENVAEARPGSFRSFFHYRLKNDPAMKDIHFVRAEELAKWYFDAINESIHFDDLLKFETQMSYLSALTCIILESPGAIAELGSFSVIEEFLNRMMVVVRDREYSEKSFISLGPIKKLQNEYNDEGGVFVYAWDVDFSINSNGNVIKTLDANQLQNIYGQFCMDLRFSLELSHKSEKFKKENMRHIYSIIVDLVAVFHCLKLKEIRKIVEHFHSGLPPKTIKVCLFFAAKLGLIRKTRYGGSDYYTSSAIKEFAEYNFTKTSKDKFSRAPFKMQVRQVIENSEQQRKYVLLRHKPETIGAGNE